MLNQKNLNYTGANNRKSLLDIELPDNPNAMVLFIHGYKGFKDWGAWNLVQSFFVANRIGFAKLNLSHNGGTTANPVDFPDTEAFGNNCYSYEVYDVESVISLLHEYVDLTSVPLFLIGHSRGGGIALLSGVNKFVKGVITWASVASFDERFPKGKELEEWKKSGVRFIKNARTKQELPHYFSFYEDFEQNKEKLTISKAALRLKESKKACFHVHGTKDEAVNVNELSRIADWTKGETLIMENANHTFAAKHPWKENTLPEELKTVCSKTLDFLSRNI